MTCPAAHHHPTPVPRPAVVERFHWFGGTVFVALFSAALFDQVALPPVAAGVESTGRIRNTPFERAIRTAASEQLIHWAEAEDHEAEAARLRRLHRDIRGVGYNGVRYSALTPESWNWIMISTFRMHRGAYLATTGDRLDDADEQAIWDHFRTQVDGLQLPGNSRLPEDHAEVREYYERIVREKCLANITLDGAVAAMLAPPMPESLPRAATPLWTLLAPAVGHLTHVLGFGVLHPGVRALTNPKWTRRHDLEFAALTTLLRVGYRFLPKRLTYTPLAYNRWQYEQITGRYRARGLTSFRPDQRA
ncbi:MAG TPA: oxygenase MpaB family protein [Pseudonocardiaceae bacterium]